MNKAPFSKFLEEYFLYRGVCGMKESPTKDITTFYMKSKREFPGESRLTQKMIDSWWEKRKSENCNSHATRVCAIIPFLVFVRQRHPETGIIIPKTPKWKRSEYTPHAFTEDELRRFFDVCDAKKRPYNSLECKLNEIEFPILFRLLLSTGMRTTEVRLLKAKNVNLAKGTIYIEKDATKGYRERIVPVHDSMLKALRIYDKAVDKLIPDRKVFFPNDHDITHPRTWIACHFKQMWRVSGNVKGVRAYDLRHHFIISAINSWIDLGCRIHSRVVTLSKYVGHSSVQETYSYFSYVPQLGVEIERKSSRMDKIQKIKYLPNEEQD